MWYKVKENVWFPDIPVNTLKDECKCKNYLNVGTIWMAVVYNVFSGFCHSCVRLRNGKVADSQKLVYNYSQTVVQSVLRPPA